MSTNIIDATIKYAKKHRKQLMLIASRRQVELGAFHSSYVMDTEDFVNYIKSQEPKNILICRDHGGPYQGYNEARLSYDTAVRRAKQSFDIDIKNGFDLLHVDCSLCEGREMGTALDIMKYCRKVKKDIMFEVGTEENIGCSTNLMKIKEEIGFFKRRGIVPEFVVGQTGSLLKETFQAGIFDYTNVRKLTNIAHSYEVKFKEHNADYITFDDMKLRKETGVDAVNVGPQLAHMQTRTIIDFTKEYGLLKELYAFIKVSYRTKNWKQWLYGKIHQDFYLGIIAGHYAY